MLVISIISQGAYEPVSKVKIVIYLLRKRSLHEEMFHDLKCRILMVSGWDYIFQYCNHASLLISI